MTIHRLPRLSTAVVAATAATTAMWSAAQGVAAPAQSPSIGQPIRIGIGGEFPAGFEGMIARLGLPHERIWIRQLGDAEVLKQYDIVFASSCIPGDSRFPKALREYVQAGGKAVLEMWRQPQGGLLPGGLVAAHGAINIKIADASHPIAHGYAAGDTILSSETTQWGLAVNDSENIKVVARYAKDGPAQVAAGNPLLRGGGLPAIVCIKMGKGELVFCGCPIGFPIGWRSPQLEPIAINIINYLLAGRAAPRFLPDLLPQPRPFDGVSMGKPLADEKTTVRRPSAAPDGFASADAPERADFNIRGTLVQTTAPSDRALPVLLIDCVSAENHTALGYRKGKLSLWEARRGARKVLWRSDEPAPDGEADLIVKRRRDQLMVVLDGRVIALVKRTAKVVGGVWYRGAGNGPHLKDVWCQAVARPYFTDDFMRESGETTPWRVAAGDWKQLGLDHPEQSVNGFTYVASAASDALSGAGDWFWEDYTLSAAVKPLTTGASVGLTFERLGEDSYAVFKVDNRARTDAAAHLLRVTTGGTDELARAPAGCETGQWSRLAVRLMDGRIEGYIDGRRVIEAADDSARCGAIGLYASDGKVAFDDVQLVPSEEATDASIATFREEGTPEALLPINVGPTDYMSWANRAIEWHADWRRPSLLWHKALYFHDVSLALTLPPPGPEEFGATLILSQDRTLQRARTVRVQVAPNARKATIELHGGKRGGKRVTVRLGEDAKRSPTISLARLGNRMVVACDGKRLLSAKATAGPLSAGVELRGAPLPISSLRVESPNIRDYTFAAAPTDWRSSTGTWQVLSRWACDPRWSWYTGYSEGIAGVWNKRRFEGDMCLDIWIAVKHKGPGGDETQRRRDLNCVIFGDGNDPKTGYSFVIGGSGGVTTGLMRNGQVVAENPEIKIPEAYSVHHQWFHVQATKVGHKISLSFQDRPALEYDDPDPIDGGFVGIWTRNSAICLSRVTIYYDREDPTVMLGG